MIAGLKGPEASNANPAGLAFPYLPLWTVHVPAMLQGTNLNGKESLASWPAFMLTCCLIPCGKQVWGISLQFVIAIRLVAVFPNKAACPLLCK